MGLAARIALAVVILLVDVVTFFIPFGALVIACVIVLRPRWALEFIVKLYEGVDFGRGKAGEQPPGSAGEPREK